MGGGVDDITGTSSSSSVSPVTTPSSVSVYGGGLMREGGWKVVKLNEESAERYRYPIEQISFGPEIVDIKIYELYTIYPRRGERARDAMSSTRGAGTLESVVAVAGTFISRSAGLVNFYAFSRTPPK